MSAPLAVRCALFVCAVVAARCSSASSSPDGGASAVPPAIDGGVADGSVDPATDAGRPTGGGAPDASTALPPRPDAGPPEAFCTLADAAGPGDPSEAEQGLSTDCEGLVPDFPGVPRQLTFEMGTHSGCSGATTDGDGTLAFGTVEGGTLRSQFLFHTADGRPLGNLPGDALAPQPHGFAVHEVDPEFPHASAIRFADGQRHGAQLVSNEAVAISGVPGGGAVAVERPWNVEHWWMTTHRFDAAGERVGHATDVLEGAFETRPQAFAVGTATDGAALVVLTGEPFGDPAALYGVWIDENGGRVGDPFRVTAGSPAALLVRPLVDGSVVVRADGKWRARIGNRTSTVRDPPIWLVGLSGRDFQLRKRGAGFGGYVALFASALGTFARCGPLLEVRAPAGNRCGTLAVPEAVVRADVGQDGTLIWFTVGQPCTFGICCQWRWWTGLLR